MNEDSKVSQTALKVASMMLSLGADRAWREQLPPGLVDLTRELLLAAKEPLYTPTVIAFLERRTAFLMSRASERVLPGIFTGIGKRKIFIDEHARAALHTGAIQVLVIGAGLDTLCLRLAPANPDVTFFELDHPATAQAKARGLNVIGWPGNLTQITADLGQRPLTDVLAETDGWNSDAITLIVAEGLLMYLTPEDVRMLFDNVAASVAAGSQFVFSYPLGVRRYALSNALLRMMGEPWLSHTNKASLPGYVGDAWSVTEAVEPMGPRAIEGFGVAVKPAA